MREESPRTSTREEALRAYEAAQAAWTEADHDLTEISKVLNQFEDDRDELERKFVEADENLDRTWWAYQDAIGAEQEV